MYLTSRSPTTSSPVKSSKVIECSLVAPNVSKPFDNKNIINKKYGSHLPYTIYIYVCMYLCICVCMYARMYVCMYVCMYVYLYRAIIVLKLNILPGSSNSKEKLSPTKEVRRVIHNPPSVFIMNELSKKYFFT